jgi:cation diffusion facilitator family transporter
VGIVASGALSVAKLVAGWLAHSTAVFADGLENLADLFGSGLVLYGLMVAARPPDKEHPYGHGRSETIAGLAVGMILATSGVLICYHSFRRLREGSESPHFFAVWPMLASVLVKTGLTVGKLTYGKRLRSAALTADARHDGVEIFSGLVALSALALTLHDPTHFAAADHWGGLAVGLIALVTAWQVVRDTSGELMDVMPEDARIEHIRQVTRSVPGVTGVEKVFARKTGLRYHVELHIEVDPEMTVRAAHEVAGNARRLIRKELDWVADVVVHVEPAPSERRA